MHRSGRTPKRTGGRAGRGKSIAVVMPVVGVVALLVVAMFVGVRMWRNRQDRGPDVVRDGGPVRPEFRELGTVASGRPSVTAIAWRPDGARIATGHADGSVSMWDSATGAELLTGRGKSDEAVESMSWSPDGQLLAAAHRHDHMTVWNAASADAIWEVDGGDIYAVVGWSEDGRSVKTYNGEEYYALWNVDSRAAAQLVRGIAQQGEVVSPDGHLAAGVDGGRPLTLHRTDWQPGPVASRWNF